MHKKNTNTVFMPGQLLSLCKEAAHTCTHNYKHVMHEFSQIQIFCSLHRHKNLHFKTRFQALNAIM